MNAVTKIDPLKEKTITVQANQGFVSGRLGDRRKFKTKDGVRWFQLLLTPAPMKVHKRSIKKKHFRTKNVDQPLVFAMFLMRQLKIAI